jgi:phage terminase large subunit-like protein
MFMERYKEWILSATKSEDSIYLASTVWERLSAAIFARFAFVLARFARG